MNTSLLTLVHVRRLLKPFQALMSFATDLLHRFLKRIEGHVWYIYGHMCVCERERASERARWIDTERLIEREETQCSQSRRKGRLVSEADVRAWHW